MGIRVGVATVIGAVGGGMFFAFLYTLANLIVSGRLVSVREWENHPLVLIIAIVTIAISGISTGVYSDLSNQQRSLVHSSLTYAVTAMILWGLGGLIAGCVYGYIRRPSEPVNLLVTIWIGSITGVFIGLISQIGNLLDRMYDEVLRLEKIKGQQSAGDCFIVTATLKAQNKEQILNILRHWRDSVLVKHTVGFRLLMIYKIIGPRVAKYLEENT